jgi:GNAT superfamily N-acetyltransferase
MRQDRGMTAQSGVQVRAATAHDAEAVWPLARDFATSFAPERQAFNATFRALLSRDDTMVCVAVRDAGVVGYLLASHHLTFLANGSVCWVEELMVHPDRRRQGIGAQLMTAAEQWARDQGDAYLSLATRRASDFYVALGYEQSATFFKKTLTAPARP